MINITEKKKCCGCSACINICPNKCITFEEDNEGFCYPIVNEKQCINCGLCEKVCPFLFDTECKEPIATYAAINPNELTRINSSSGGIFSLFAESVIKYRGIVFGAKFDSEWNVIHGYTENIEGIKAFRGSKYVQSLIGESFIQTKNFLTQGRKVLFTGTPCQIKGLKGFLRKDYENLVLCSVACTGVPSPKVWKSFLNEISQNEITNIQFRDKSDGWNNYRLTIYSKEKVIFSEKGLETTYMQGMLKHIINRPSCACCPAKNGKCGSDILLADFWGINKLKPELFDNKGASLVLVFTDKGNRFLKNTKGNYYEVDFKRSINNNMAIIYSSPSSIHRQEFFEEYNNRGTKALKLILKYYYGSKPEKIYLKIRSIFKRIFK